MQKTISGLLFLFILISSLLFYSIILLKDFRKSTDISLYPVKNTERKHSSEKTWLISYASDGVYIQNQNNLNMSAAMTQAFDVVLSYQPQHMEPEYYEKHKEILSQKRGVGYWLWKPYFILKTLKMMPENDVLLAVDRSTIFRDKIYQVLELAKHHDITLFPFADITNRKYMKRAVVDKMANGDESILEKPHLEGGFLLLRNNAKTRKFIEEWLHYCEDPELLTDIPSKGGEYPGFKDHRHDQAVLTALYYQHPERYHLYSAYPARLEALCVTRRADRNCSLASVTFSKKLGNLNWPAWTKKYLNWLIGCQASTEEPDWAQCN